MKKHHPLWWIAAGLLLMAGAVAYGVFSVGIPGPDDSPAELARQSSAGHIAVGAFLVGLLGLLAGSISGAFRLVARLRR